MLIIEAQVPARGEAIFVLGCVLIFKSKSKFNLKIKVCVKKNMKIYHLTSFFPAMCKTDIALVMDSVGDNMQLAFHTKRLETEINIR